MLGVGAGQVDEACVWEELVMDESAEVLVGGDEDPAGGGGQVGELGGRVWAASASWPCWLSQRAVASPAQRSTRNFMWEVGSRWTVTVSLQAAQIVVAHLWQMASAHWVWGMVRWWRPSWWGLGRPVELGGMMTSPWGPSRLGRRVR